MKPVQRLRARLLLASYWPALSHMASPSCQKSWGHGLQLGSQKGRISSLCHTPQTALWLAFRDRLLWVGLMVVVPQWPALAEAHVDDVWVIGEAELRICNPVIQQTQLWLAWEGAFIMRTRALAHSEIPYTIVGPEGWPGRQGQIGINTNTVQAKHSSSH